VTGRVVVHVQPRARRTEVVGPFGDAVKVRLAAPPVDGAANAELVRFVAERLGVARASVRVVTGAAARRKVVEVDGFDGAAVRRGLLRPTSP
jgi:uncharacterized protein (TIGR00251 family)